MQARSAQSANLEISHRVNSSMRLPVSRQGNAVFAINVVERHEIGNRSISTANENQLVEDKFTIKHCRNARCKTCPKFNTSLKFQSTVSGKTYNVVNHSNENINCHSQNLIYLLTCEGCHLQHVGETTQPLNKRMNLHRTSKSGCKNIINHYKNGCIGFTFSIQVIEILEGTGYNEIDEVDEDLRKKHLEIEEKWMKEIRTIYPYGLNERAKELRNTKDLFRAIGTLFPPLRKHGVRERRNRLNRNNKMSHISSKDFFASLNTIFKNNLKTSFNRIRLTLNKAKKGVLKEIANIILNKDPVLDYVEHRQQWYDYILDIIDTKLFKPEIKTQIKTTPKNVCVVYFENKVLEKSNLSSILNSNNILPLLPETLRNKEYIPVVVYKLSNTVRNKILNYKDAVDSIFTDEEVSFSTTVLLVIAKTLHFVILITNTLSLVILELYQIKSCINRYQKVPITGINVL